MLKKWFFEKKCKKNYNWLWGRRIRETAQLCQLSSGLATRSLCSCFLQRHFCKSMEKHLRLKTPTSATGCNRTGSATWPWPEKETIHVCHLSPSSPTKSASPGRPFLKPSEIGWPTIGPTLRSSLASTSSRKNQAPTTKSSYTLLAVRIGPTKICKSFQWTKHSDCQLTITEKMF